MKRTISGFDKMPELEPMSTKSNSRAVVIILTLTLLATILGTELLRYKTEFYPSSTSWQELTKQGLHKFEEGDLRTAEEIYKKALQIAESLSDNHKIAASLNNLAAVYRDEGKYNDAESLYLKSLEVHREEMGSGQGEIATTLGNLADINAYTGRFEKATDLYQQALAVSRKSSDKNRTARLLSSLAGVWQDRGNLREAEKLLLQARDLVESRDSRATSAILNNLGVLKYAEGNYREAEVFFRRVLELRKDDPIVTSIVLSNLAEIVEAKGDLREAKELEERALKLRVRTLGNEHPDVASSMVSLGRIYSSEGDYSKANALLNRALDIYRRSGDRLGEAHTLGALAVNHMKRGDYLLAERLFRQATELFRSTDDFISLADSLQSYAELLRKLGRDSKAREYLQEADTLRKRGVASG
jgi:tetratricopeptide (TPR) repeat protein